MSEEVVENATKTKKKREKPEDFIGETFNNGKLRVIGIAGKQGREMTFKVTCTECSKDPELFPDGYFVSQKGNLVNGQKPCVCSKYKWEYWQFLILARRAGDKKGFIVHGFVGKFKNCKTKLNLECIIDGHKWSASINNIINQDNGCPKCKGSNLADQRKTPEHVALQKCIDICKAMNYEVTGFVDGYKNNKSRFEYTCPKHGIQTVRYSNFVNSGHRCGGCWKERQLEILRDGRNGNGHYPERKYEIDFLYVLNFDDKFIKVGRSFDIEGRISDLKTPSESGIKNIKKLRIFTATHQEIYDYEQEIHKELRERNFQYYVDWSTECFENDCKFVLNKLLDNCELEEVIY